MDCRTLGGSRLCPFCCCLLLSIFFFTNHSNLRFVLPYSEVYKIRLDDPRFQAMQCGIKPANLVLAPISMKFLNQRVCLNELVNQDVLNGFCGVAYEWVPEQ